MSKTINVLPSLSLVAHPDLTARTYPPGRQVYVGRVDSLQNAVASALPGDEIIIDGPRTYNLTNTLVVNQPDVTIRGISPNAGDIILRGAGMDEVNYGGAPYGIYSAQPGLAVKNLTIQDFYHHAITFAAGAERPIFENVHMLDIGTQFVKISAFPYAINKGRMSRCRIGYTAGRPTTNHGSGFFYGGGLDLHNSYGWEIQDSVFFELSPTAEEEAATAGQPRHLWSPAILIWNRSRDNITERCLFINCARAVSYGLMDRYNSPDAAHDNLRGIVRNNMAIMQPGRLGSYQISQSDGMFLGWDSPDTQFLHNTIVTNSQVADAIQGRWSQNLVIHGNLCTDTVRMRDSATFTGVNQLTAQNTWFQDTTTGNLRLSSLGIAQAQTQARNPNCLTDFDSVLRDVITRMGASVNG